MIASPRRTCVGCRRTAPPGELHRVAAGADGRLRVGRGAPGRGAWVCSPECFDAAAVRGALARALRRPVPDAEIGDLRARLVGPPAGGGGDG